MMAIHNQVLDLVRSSGTHNLFERFPIVRKGRVFTELPPTFSLCLVDLDFEFPFGVVQSSLIVSSGMFDPFSLALDNLRPQVSKERRPPWVREPARTLDRNMRCDHFLKRIRKDHGISVNIGWSKERCPR
jgi:hypothetical protein